MLLYESTFETQCTDFSFYCIQVLDLYTFLHFGIHWNIHKMKILSHVKKRENINNINIWQYQVFKNKLVLYKYTFVQCTSC